MSEQSLNHFSLISRLFGNLFYRAPTDPVLAGVFAWLQQNQLSPIWPLETDKPSQQALEALQMTIAPSTLQAEYEKLFGNAQQTGSVLTSLAAYEIDAEEFAAFRQMRAMPALENHDNVALLLLTASWIEDNLDSTSAQQQFFEQFLLPAMAKFLSKVETQASLPFYRALALLTRELLAATADELVDEEEA